MIIPLYPKPVIYFDGVCNLCNGAVQFVIKHDKRKIFRFSTLQSFTGTTAAENINLKNSQPGTVLLFFRGRYYTKSSAALHTLRLLGGFWQLLFVFIIVPPFIRNFVYNVVAKNRYKWFGKREQCMAPTQELRERFMM